MDVQCPGFTVYLDLIARFRAVPVQPMADPVLAFA